MKENIKHFRCLIVTLKTKVKSGKSFKGQNEKALNTTSAVLLNPRAAIYKVKVNKN